MRFVARFEKLILLLITGQNKLLKIFLKAQVHGVFLKVRLVLFIKPGSEKFFCQFFSVNKYSLRFLRHSKLSLNFLVFLIGCQT